MPIRLLHTADNHIGLPFRQYPSDSPAAAGSRLVAERFEALGRLVATANERQADFLVVAGDLFDSTRVKATDIERTADLLKGFAGTVLVLPGNHDHFAGPDTEVWKRFQKAIEGASNVELLAEPVVRTFEVEGTSVHFFPCPCPSKTGAEPMIGWVADAARACLPGLKIGIAHGNVTGLGLDAEGQYFTMEPEALEAAGMATWLLGHIHVPFPTTASGTLSPFFMAGTHTPDSLRCTHAGSAWWIECEGDRVSRYERLAPGRLRFVRLERELASGHDVAALLAECKSLDAGRTILDLQLTGRLSAAEKSTLDEAVAALAETFVRVSCESEIHGRIDAALIATLYRDGGLAHRLLTGLLADADHPDAATLAHELIEEVSRR